MVTPVHPVTRLPQNVELRLDHVKFRGISNGKVVWEVVAEHFDLSKDQMTFKVTGLKKVTLVKDGKQELTVTADGLDRNTLTGDLSIHGNVMVMGKDILLRTPTVNWRDRLQVLDIPNQLSAQLQDITLIATDGASYNISDGMLRSGGKIVLGYKGNLLRANGVLLNVRQQSFTISGPVAADLVVNDVQQWINGKALPEIPEIPDQVKERYHDYCVQHGYR